MILCMVTNQLMAGACRMLCEEHCAYEIRCLISPPYVKAGRRLAVGFRQIVPGVFPSGVVTPMKLAAWLASHMCGDWPPVSSKLSQRSAGLYTDRLRLAAVE